MSNEHHQLIATWVKRLQSAEAQIAPWNQKIWVQYQPILVAAEQQKDLLLVVHYLQQMAPVLVAGRWWYRYMFPIRFLGKLLYTIILLIYAPFTIRFYRRLLGVLSGWKKVLVQLFGGLVFIAFIGLVIYHRTLYDQGNDLGWTYAHALFFALLIVVPVQSLLLFVVGQVLSIAEYWRQSIPKML